MGSPSGPSPVLQLPLTAYPSIKTPILYSVGVNLYAGLPNDECLVDKWVILLEINGIHILLGMMKASKVFSALRGWKEEMI